MLLFLFLLWTWSWFLYGVYGISTYCIDNNCHPLTAVVLRNWQLAIGKLIKLKRLLRCHSVYELLSLQLKTAVVGNCSEWWLKKFWQLLLTRKWNWCPALTFRTVILGRTLCSSCRLETGKIAFILWAFNSHPSPFQVQSPKDL